MAIKAVFQWIYALDFHTVLIFLALFTVLFCLLHLKLHAYRFWKFTAGAALLVWAGVVVLQTVIQREHTVFSEPIWQPFQSYYDALKENGQRELLRSNFMNAALFYPAGVLLVSVFPEKRKPAVKLGAVLLPAAAFSAAIEITQYYCHLGLAQTDDVIHNALGALIGAACTLVILRVFAGIKRRFG